MCGLPGESGGALRVPAPQVALGELPVEQVVDDGGDVRRATFMVIEVVGVLPDVDREQRMAAVGDGRVGVRGGRDAQLAAVRGEPCPAAAEDADGGQL